jgi:cell division protein FtsW (lipid II flippase)
LAALFLGLFALSLTLSPAVRNRTWDVSYRWEHWISFAVWALVFYLIHIQTSRFLKNRDPFLVPIAALLSGWGLLAIWRLFPTFGLRQTTWLFIASLILILGLRLKSDLSFLRRYKYIWLTAGLLLTALTLLFGTNPTGYGPRLWLGCCGVYLQPSEPLKLLLIVYLAAYFADYQHILLLSKPGLSRSVSPSLLALLAPTLLMTGLALLLLLVQRDLGTASIFLIIYAIIVFTATKRYSILLVSVITIILAGIAGYFLFDVVRLRVEAWLNPWLDPSGRSYQIVQSLIAVANGGLLGRGPGQGNPTLVPIPHSDFIYAAIVEELGLVGAIAIIILLAFLTVRGLITAFYAPDRFRRYLAAGITIYLVAQSVLIISGNLRLLPLTGVTLPLISYGGSSLVTTFIALLILLHISNSALAHTTTVPETRPYKILGGLLFIGLIAIALVTGWWAYYRGPDLLERTDNARRAIADRYVQRGAILDRHDNPLAASTGAPGTFIRESLYPALGAIIGYTHPVYGQSGLEASLDSYLRGLRGNPGLTIWWHHILYGQPPPGLDTRLSLDQELQASADHLLTQHKGAIVLLNAQNGEILAISSAPTFDPNQLDDTWSELIKDPETPLFNRATLGRYPAGTALGAFMMAAAIEEGDLPNAPTMQTYTLDDLSLECASEPANFTWDTLVSSGCPHSQVALGQFLGPQKVLELYKELGLYSAPPLRLPTDSSSEPIEFSDQERAYLGVDDVKVNPLQLALAAATLSNGGIRPAPRLVTSVKTPAAGWVTLPALSEPVQDFSRNTADNAALKLQTTYSPTWQTTAVVPNGPDDYVTWYIAGTLPGWGGTPLTLVILLESDDPATAESIGQDLLQTAIGN